MVIQPNQPQQPAGKKIDWWHELASGELLQAGLHLSPANLQDAVEATRDIGKSLGNSWDDIKDQVTKVLHLPAVGNVLTAEQRQRIADVAITAASTVGYAAAGVQAVVGIAKLKHGVEEKNPLKRFEGCLDIVTAGAITSTIANMGVIPLILGPLAAALGVVRGGIHAVAGYRTDDDRREVQGLMDGVRSAAVLGNLLGRHSGLAATAGAILGPVAGAIQATRGFMDVSGGLKEKDKAKQLQGLCDIGAAVGLTMAATGVGVIPGVILTVVSVGARVLYQVSEKFEKRADQTLGKWEPGLQKAVDAVESVANPIIDRVRPLIEKLTGWHHGDQAGGTSPSPTSPKTT